MAKGGITREIILGGKTVKIRMSAATPILYNQMIGRDFFADLTRFNDTCQSSKRDDGLDIDVFVFKGLTYVAMSQASSKSLPKFVQWIDEYSEEELSEVLQDVLACWNENSQGTAQEKKEVSE